MERLVERGGHESVEGRDHQTHRQSMVCTNGASEKTNDIVA